MKKLLFLLFLLIFTSVSAYCSIEDDIFYLNEDGTKFTQNASNYPKIDKIEMRIFSKKYSSEPINIRLNRIENKIFKTTYQGSELLKRVDNITAYFDRKDVSNADFNTLSKIEKKVFGFEQRADVQTRVEKLETSVFGMFQEGELKNRIGMLSRAILKDKEKVAEKDEIEYQNVYPYAPIKKTPLNKMRSKFSGTLTGYTPPVTQPYCAIPQNQHNFRTPSQAYTHAQMQQIHKNYDPFFGGKIYNEDFQDLFSADVGDETYYSNGEFSKYKSKSRGGVGVHIIRD